MQTQIVTFCLGGSMVPSAQPWRLRPRSWEQKGDSQLSLQGRWVFLFPSYRAEKKGFAWAVDFVRLLSCCYTSQGCNHILQLHQLLLLGIRLNFYQLHITLCFCSMLTYYPELTSSIWRTEWIKACYCSSWKPKVAKQHWFLAIKNTYILEYMFRFILFPCSFMWMPKGKVVFGLTCNTVWRENHIALLELKSSLDAFSRYKALWHSLKNVKHSYC